MAFDETPQESRISLNKKIIYALIGGAVITLVTSIIPNNTTIGASNFGYPFPWVYLPLYPIGSPPTIIWTALTIDDIAWTIVAFVLIIGYYFFKSR